MEREKSERKGIFPEPQRIPRRTARLNGDEKQGVIFQNTGLCSGDMPPSFYGQVILDILLAYPEKEWMADELFRCCTKEQKRMASPRLLLMAVIYKKESMALDLIRSGISADRYAADIIRALTKNHLEWLTEYFTKNRRCVSIRNFSALWACIETGQRKAAWNLLIRGIDYEEFQIWRKVSGYTMPESMQNVLGEYWEVIKMAQKLAEDSTFGWNGKGERE